MLTITGKHILAEHTEAGTEETRKLSLVISYQQQEHPHGSVPQLSYTM